MLYALSTGQKLGLGITAAIFVIFALLSSMVIPRFRPDFPGTRGLRLFVVVSLVLFVASLTAVELFGAEEHAGVEEHAQTGPAKTGQEPPGGMAKGDPDAGRQLFAQQGCGSCHAFEPAGSNGTVGPNLGELAAHAEAAGRGSLEEYTAESIREPNAYVVEGFDPGIMPAYDALSEGELDDLVAFLTQPS